ncbi:hypothetical protein [Parafilimonas terrae]|uniref:TonB protein C-terminal n=1 Tax=Parafilimonas terrae TaxID=1465490 RepID=A0A1I5WBZ2_9BACT|nr:hypothetical protein [Parafilimonas terrae]SFQ17243.1 hypothetical protein SAMN05444277_10685 [Parafilimonas terrae]
MKPLKSFLFLVCVFATITTFAQTQKFLSIQYSDKVSLQTALIRINNKPATYNDLLKIQDSSVLKVEVYSKKAALEYVDKDEAKNGLVLVTLHKKHFPAFAERKDSAAFVIGENGDTIFCSSLKHAGINGDTTDTEWNKFLLHSLNAQVPADNSAPPGIYNVDIMFTVNLDSSVSNLNMLEDPGYGTGSEVRRLMNKSPVWTPGSCDGQPVRFHERQRIVFVVTEQ